MKKTTEQHLCGRCYYPRVARGEMVMAVTKNTEKRPCDQCGRMRYCRPVIVEAKRAAG